MATPSVVSNPNTLNNCHKIHNSPRDLLLKKKMFITHEEEKNAAFVFEAKLNLLLKY